MTDRPLTIFLVPAGDHRVATAHSVLVNLRDVPAPTRVWTADVTNSGMPDAPYAAVVAGEAAALRPLLAAFSPREIAAAARRFKDDTTADDNGCVEGVSILSFIAAYPDVDRVETVRRWREHAPLALEIHHAARRYVQYELLDGLDGEPGYAGMANLHLPDVEALATGMFRTEADVTVIAADVARFVHHHDTFLAHEHALGDDGMGSDSQDKE